MRAGRLRHKITFRQKTSTRSPSGAEVVTWTTFAENIPAEIRPLNERSLASLRQIHSDITTKLVVRYLAGVNSAMQVRFQGDDYDIREVINVGQRNRELEILCVGPVLNG